MTSVALNNTGAALLLPLVNDLHRNGPDSYLLGAVSGAADMLEKQGVISEAEYNLIIAAAASDCAGLLAVLTEMAQPTQGDTP